MKKLKIYHNFSPAKYEPKNVTAKNVHNHRYEYLKEASDIQDRNRLKGLKNLGSLIFMVHTNSFVLSVCCFP